jgi:hypothetical protein
MKRTNNHTKNHNNDKRSRGAYGGCVCTVDRWLWDGDGMLHIQCAIRKIDEDRDNLKWLTRYQQVQELLRRQSWKVAKIQFTSSTIALSAKVSVSIWLKQRGYKIDSSVSGSTLFIFEKGQNVDTLVHSARSATRLQLVRRRRKELRRITKTASAEAKTKSAKAKSTKAKIAKAKSGAKSAKTDAKTRGKTKTAVQNASNSELHKVDKRQPLCEQRVVYMGSPFGDLGALMKEEGQKLAVFILFIVIILVMYLFFMIVR